MCLERGGYKRISLKEEVKREGKLPSVVYVLSFGLIAPLKTRICSVKAARI